MTQYRLVAYLTQDGAMGIAHVPAASAAVTATECRNVVPGFVGGDDLGPAPLFTLRYSTSGGETVRVLPFPGVQSVGVLVARLAERGEAWGIEVLDADGFDCTFDFPVFCG